MHVITDSSVTVSGLAANYQLYDTIAKAKQGLIKDDFATAISPYLQTMPGAPAERLLNGHHVPTLSSLRASEYDSLKKINKHA
eukprot:scaffold676881_cov92-Prasinocladus_malaysianus.AAC.1